MRFAAIVLGFACATVLHGQDPAESTDAHDQLILAETLYVSVDPTDVRRSEDVQELVIKQADAMVAAAQRRVLRQEQAIAEMTAAIHSLKAQQSEMQPLIDEMKKRLDVASLAIDRASTLRSLIESIRAEQKFKVARSRGGAVEKFKGKGFYAPVDMKLISRAYLRKFGEFIPISARGDTDLHRALGFDHTGRVDVALSPDQPQGAWLCRYLQSLGIPYYAFRRAIPGSATAPHIHIGPGSTRRRT